MPKRKDKQNIPEKDFYEVLTRFEENVCEALTLNSTLSVLIDNDNFRDFNLELIFRISQRLRDAKEEIKAGYKCMAAMKRESSNY